MYPQSNRKCHPYMHTNTTSSRDDYDQKKKASKQISHESKFCHHCFVAMESLYKKKESKRKRSRSALGHPDRNDRRALRKDK